MVKWDYNLGFKGTVLRDLIRQNDSSQENCIAILEQIIKCCKWLLTHLHEDDKDEYDWDLEDIIQDCEDAKYYLDEDDWETNEENINDVLEDFYDLMDEMRVWITV